MTLPNDLLDLIKDPRNGDLRQAWNDWQEAKMREGAAYCELIKKLWAQNEHLRQSIRALIEVYAPHERKAVLRQKHLSE